MSELADALHARIDETARADIARVIERSGLDPDDPEIQQAVTDTLYGTSIELERTMKHLGIALLDAVPGVGPWMLRQIGGVR